MAVLKVPVTSRDHIQGDESAPITLLEYGDYQCPHCGRAYPIVKALQKQYGKQLRFAFRHFPLVEIHPLAESTSEAVEYAGTQGLFWKMHDGIFENQDQLSLPLLMELAKLLGLSIVDVSNAIANHEFGERIRQDFLSGARSGVNGTPTFFINDIRHDGPYEFEDLVSAINTQLLLLKSTPEFRSY
jgi:protein-disulfide isomerase